MERRREPILGRPVDPSTGRDRPGYAPIPAGKSAQFARKNAFSEDGGSLAAVEFRGTYCAYSGGGGNCSTASAAVLHLIDLRVWDEVTAPLPGNGAVLQIAFSPDATRVALVYAESEFYGRQVTYKLMVFDAATGEVAAERHLEFRPSLLEYGRDGSRLVIYGAADGPNRGISKPGAPRLLLLNAKSLQVTWDRLFPDIVSGEWCEESCGSGIEYYNYSDSMKFVRWTPAVVLSEDRSRLYIVHADDEMMTTVDLAARSVQDAEIGAARSWIEGLLDLTAGVAEAKSGALGADKAAALSADGARLYVLGYTTDTRGDNYSGRRPRQTSLGLRIVDVKSGHKIGTLDSDARGVRFTQDDAFLLLDSPLSGDQITEVIDVESLDSVATLSDWYPWLGRDLEGAPIILSNKSVEETTRFAVIYPETFEVVETWSVEGMARWVMPCC